MRSNLGHRKPIIGRHWISSEYRWSYASTPRYVFMAICLIKHRREFFYSPPRPDRLWGPPSLLSNGYRGFFHGGKAAGTWSRPLTFI